MTGLVLEGGASRTVYSCGILDVMLENGIVADRVYGVSAGSAFGVSYCSGQVGRNYRLATEFMGRPEYMGFKHLLDPRNRSYYNLKYAYDDVPNIWLPFDYEAYKLSRSKLYAVVTNVETGKAEYLYVDGNDRQWTLLQASCALPLLFPEIEWEGKKYLDGGLADSIPYKRALEDGCDKVIVILTRPKEYRKTTDGSTKLAMRRYASKYPELVKTMATRAERYNQALEDLAVLKSRGKAAVFAPRTTFGVQRIEGDPRKLERLYRHGRKHGERELERLRAYLSK